jgi:GrpB-like predicted nucleotidyltransferase (UPF0157 family)
MEEITMRGKKSGTREIVAYDPSWAIDFEFDRQELANALAGYDLDIRHIGSTSIKGCMAKPVIDIIIGYKTKDKDKVSEMLAKVKAISGYRESKYENMNAHNGEYNTGKYNGDGDCINHTFFNEVNSKPWNERVLFKRYLEEHPEEIKRYSEVKMRASQNYKNGGSYNTGEGGKSTYVRDIIKKAYEVYGIDFNGYCDYKSPEQQQTTR